MGLKPVAHAAMGKLHDRRDSGNSSPTSSDGESLDAPAEKTWPYGIDLTKPILPQVPSLGENYDAWVHMPSTRPTFRMFESDVFEFFATMSWWMVPLVWLPVSAFFLRTAGQIAVIEEGVCQSFGVPDTTSDGNGSDAGVGCDEHTKMLSGYGVGYWYVVGLMFWTAAEYLLHRFLFHSPLISYSPFFLKFHYLLHGQHHKFPLDKGRLVFPLVPATITGSFLYSLIALVLPAAQACATFGGVVHGYICYDLTHYYIHHGAPTSSWFKSLKSHHMAHHFKDTERGFGITSHIWDIVFNTEHADRKSR